MVEHADRHPLLLVTLDVAHEAGDGRMDGEDDPVVAGEVAKTLGPRVVHPEPLLEVDLAGGVRAFQEQLDRRFGALLRGNACGAEMELSHASQAIRSKARRRS